MKMKSKKNTKKLTKQNRKKQITRKSKKYTKKYGGWSFPWKRSNSYVLPKLNNQPEVYNNPGITKNNQTNIYIYQEKEKIKKYIHTDYNTADSDIDSDYLRNKLGINIDLSIDLVFLKTYLSNLKKLQLISAYLGIRNEELGELNLIDIEKKINDLCIFFNINPKFKTVDELKNNLKKKQNNLKKKQNNLKIFEYKIKILLLLEILAIIRIEFEIVKVFERNNSIMNNSKKRYIDIFISNIYPHTTEELRYELKNLLIKYNPKKYTLENYMDMSSGPNNNLTGYESGYGSNNKNNFLTKPAPRPNKENARLAELNGSSKTNNNSNLTESLHV